MSARSKLPSSGFTPVATTRETVRQIMHPAVPQTEKSSLDGYRIENITSGEGKDGIWTAPCKN